MMKLTFHPTPTTRLMAMIFKPNPKPPKPTATRKPQQQAGSHHKPKGDHQEGDSRNFTNHHPQRGGNVYCYVVKHLYYALLRFIGVFNR